MNRSNTEKIVFNDETPFKINPKYVCDLEKYCDELESKLKGLTGDYEAQADILHETKQELEKYKWHDLRKNPNDFPVDLHGKNIMVCRLDWSNDVIYSLCTYNHKKFMEYDSEYDMEYELSSVIAWKYIEEFEDE